MADVDAVNERLNGLVTLLQAVGVGNLDKGDIERVNRGLKGSGDGGLPDARQLNDDQVEALIRKLQQAQAEAPHLIAALEAHAEARSLTGEKRSSRESSRQPPKQHQQHQEEDDDEEESEEYDDDENYPMVGHGCSDDISVVSDLTTPTVLTGVPVPEEEHYRDTLPPMIIGGGGSNGPDMMINATKKRNQISQVGRSSGSGIAPGPRRNAPAPTRSGGAAASRLKNYQSTMAKLHENPNATGFAGPSATAQGPPSPKKAPPQRRASTASGTMPSGQKVKRAPRPQRDPNNFSELASARANNWESSPPNNGSSNWNAFEAKPPSSRRRGPETTVDDDGFLVGESFDPFSPGADSNPFRSNAGDLAFGSNHRESFPSSASTDGFDAFGGGQRRPARPKRPDPQRQSTMANGPRVKERTTSARGPSREAVNPDPGQVARPRRARRASLAM